MEAALNRCLAILLNRNGTIRKEACISAVIFHICLYFLKLLTEEIILAFRP